MELDHEFTVPVPVDQAWSVLLDVERVALCMPGATLDSADGEEYAGRLKVKVGAMTITYRGTARIAVADESTRTLTIEAAAKEARGSGTASATVQARLHPSRGGTTPHTPRGPEEPASPAATGEASDEGDATRVTVHTKLNVTGRPAQFGRNILAEVGAKLISRFAKALATELESPSEAAEQAAGGAVDQQAAAEEAERRITDTRPDIPVVEAQPAPASAQEAAPAIPAQRPASPAESTVRPLPARPRQEEDAIDLLEVAGPSLAKRAVPALVAAVAFLLTVRYLFRRRRG
ncbi:SRPBCC domain-containing protein [Spirillospora sp. NPDC048911]|uniref:SRPBCC family protein n=1 Tax=Spirillospora sp. NPDC048911 TaxID=3364527 RepID=UPI00371CE52C